MATEDFERNFTATFSADVSGYIRLVGEDEEAMVHTLTAYWGLMGTAIRKHRGRVAHSPGDNLLAVF